MQRDVLLGGVEQLSHLQLREPDRLLLGPQLDLAAPVFGGVEDQLAHALIRVQHEVVLSAETFHTAALFTFMSFFAPFLTMGCK